MKLLLFIVCTFLVGVTSLAANEVSLKLLGGDVEYRLSGQNWTRATQGGSLPAGAVVSTGFHSRAEITFSGSVVKLQPLTQLTIQEIDTQKNSVNIELFLSVGNSHAEVKPSQQLGNTLIVSSPTATVTSHNSAYVFDGSNLFVEHGQADLSNGLGMSQEVSQGEFSSASQSLTVSQPSVVSSSESRDRSPEETSELSQFIKSGLAAPIFTLKIQVQ